MSADAAIAGAQTGKHSIFVPVSSPSTSTPVLGYVRPATLLWETSTPLRIMALSRWDGLVACI